MDRNTITGLILIVLLTLGWFYFVTPSEEELQQRRAEQARRDSIAAQQENRTQNLNGGDSQTARQMQNGQQGSESDEDMATLSQGNGNGQKQEMGMFGNTPVQDTSYVTVETPLYRAKFTNVGGGPAKITLKRYDTWNGRPVQLIADTTQSAYSFGFLTTENYNVETGELLFRPADERKKIRLQAGESSSLSYVLPVNENQELRVTYKFFADTYEFDVEAQFRNLQSVVVGQSVDYMWEPRMQFTEKRRQRESESTSAYSYAGGELERLNITEAGKQESSINGNVEWVASRTKFFTQIIKATRPTEGARLVGVIDGPTDLSSTNHKYQTSIRSELDENGMVSYRLFVGPLKYDALKTFDEHVYDMVDVGFSWIRWFSDPLVRYAIIPFFAFVGEFVGNYGLAIIIFAFLVKLILYPLTKKSYESMGAMRELQPEMKAIQEKYKDNPQKQQEATMKLYKKAKVNPLGGCLPMLLQFPILITLYHFFQNSIEIRQKAFLWAGDLSAPDVILSLPFNIPLLGDHLGGFVLLMSATMVVQTQLTGGQTAGAGAGGQQMKIFQYILPLVLLFVFNNFAAGLSLYYLIFNALSIVQQLMIHKNIDHSEMMKSVDSKKAKEMKRDEIKQKKGKK